MTLSPHMAQRLGRSIACALLLGAMAVPLATASGSQDKYGPLDPWAYGLVHRADNNGPLDPWAYAAIHRHSLGLRQAAKEPPVQRRAATDGFDWADAAIGAGGTFGLTLLVAGAINTVRRSRRTAATVGS